MDHGLRGAIVSGASVMLAVAIATPALAQDRAPSRLTADVSPADTVVAPNIIGFESEARGGAEAPQPFTSKDNPTVHFRSTAGINLVLGDLEEASNGNALLVGNPPENRLLIRFDVPTTRLSILVGRDYPEPYTQAGDRATLKLYRGTRLVATRGVALNRNIAADQVVAYKGRAAITKATLAFTRGGKPIVPSSEGVDDIVLAQVCTIRGSTRPNGLVGDGRANGICGLGGADRIVGGAGNDMLDGGTEPDRLNGNDGNDLLIGGAGDDVLRTLDGVGGNDTAYGGPGDDTCYVDVGDSVFFCESVISPA